LEATLGCFGRAHRHYVDDGTAAAGDPHPLAPLDSSDHAAELRLQLADPNLSHLVMVGTGRRPDRATTTCKDPIRNEVCCLLADRFPPISDPLGWPTAVAAPARELWTDTHPERTMPPMDIATHFGENLKRCRKRAN